MAFGINDTLNFCIMTTANYLTKALVMYDSLEKECKGQFNLFYFTFDDETYEYLQKIDYKNITPIALKDLEEFYPELRGTISTRSKAEYFFTCTPHIIDYVLENHGVDHITYLDADLYFYQDPRVLLDEVKENSILITDHRRHEPTKADLLTGKYCVQFIPIKNDATGREVINWWKEKCIEWCYYRYEDGKFADQGYLNEWPETFDNIIVMQNRGGGVARWSIGDYEFFLNNDKIKALNKEINEEVELIFYHFEGLKIYDKNIMRVGVLNTDTIVFDLIYKDYINRLSKKENELIEKIGISRKQFNYGPYHQNLLRFAIGEIRRFFKPKKLDRTIYYKFLNTYRWLP